MAKQRSDTEREVHPELEETVKKLTAKEKAWADAFLLTLNKTEAARQAKYKGDNSTLAHIGWENYRKAHIQAYMKDKFERLAMSSEEALFRLGEMASASLGDFAAVQVLADLEDHPKARLVKALTSDVYEDKAGKVHYKVRIELHDAQSAIINVLKVHGKFTDRVEHSGPEGGPIVIKEVRINEPVDNSE